VVVLVVVLVVLVVVVVVLVVVVNVNVPAATAAMFIRSMSLPLYPWYSTVPFEPRAHTMYARLRQPVS
jgi:hypothetical protein